MHRDEVTLAFTGSLDMANASECLQRVRDLPDPAVITLDMTGLDFIDSTGVGALVRLTQELAAAGRLLLLRGVNAEIREVLDVMGVASILNLADGEAG